MDLDEVRRAALPDPHDERDIWCGPELRWCISRIEELEAEVDRLTTQEEFAHVDMAGLHEQLAAAQAENQKMREALVIAEGVFRDYAMLHAAKEPTQENAKKVERNLHYSNICKEALSTPSSSEHLSQYRNAVIEECAKVCDSHTVDDILVGVGIAQSCATVIRAMKGQK